MVIDIVTLLLISCFAFIFFAYSLYLLNVCKSPVFFFYLPTVSDQLSFVFVTLLESLRDGSHQNGEPHCVCASRTFGDSAAIVICLRIHIVNDIPKADSKCSASAGTKLHSTAVPWGLVQCRHYFLCGPMYFTAQWMSCQNVLHFERARIAQKHESWCEQVLKFKVVVKAFITLMHSLY